MSKINVVGLGGAGCAIAKHFTAWAPYKVYLVDRLETAEENYFQLPNFRKPEKYDSEPIDFGSFFSKIEGDVIFIVAGSGLVSNASLRILEQLKHCQISVVYVMPDSAFMTSKGALQHNLVYNVFQQYARSGVFSELLIVSNQDIENVLGDVAIKDYYLRINEVISYAIHMKNFFNNATPVFGTLSNPASIARILSMGKVDLETSEETLFFSLDNVSEIGYYYAINKERLETDKSLLKKIKGQMRQKITPTRKISFGIFETNESENFAVCIARTGQIQKR